MIVVWVILAFLVFGSIGASLYFYRVGIARTHKEFLAESPDLAENFNTGEADPHRAWMESQPFREIQVTSSDGLNLTGYLLTGSPPAARTVVLVHGYTSRAADMGNFARLFHEDLGYNVLAVDCRGHGKSQGDYIGMGWPDRKDLNLWVREIVRLIPGSEIVLMGISMGAAAVLMASAEDLPVNVRGVLSDCAYTSAKEIFAYQLNRMYRLPTFPIIPLTSLVTRLKAGFFLGEASAVAQVSKTRLPVLFIHGEEDRFVPLEMVHRLAKACPSEHQVWVVPGAGHGLSFQADPQAYRTVVENWLGRTFSPNPSMPKKTPPAQAQTIG